ncbi:hypothetical protein F4212_13220 [Candidatus Poribacteria bacterium]|nr:hypothetical protein [Candidatus Poribacteria bacterium]
MILGCGELQPTALEAVGPVVTTNPPPQTPPTTEPDPDPPDNSIITVTEPDIRQTKDSLEHPLFMSAQDAIADADLQEKHEATETWVIANCDKSFFTGDDPPVMQMLFTRRTERAAYITYITTIAEVNHWNISSNRIHVVDNVDYYLLEFVVDKEEATEFSNCIGLVN